MSDEKPQSYKLLRLDNENFVTWKWQFVNVVSASGLSAIFEERAVSAEVNGKALALLGSALTEENILKIINCTTFKQAWVTLEACFENKTSYEPQALYRRMNNFKINTAADVSKGIGELRGIVAQLKNLDEQVSDNCLIGAILSALPRSFDVFTQVWKNSASKDVDGLINKLMAEASDQMTRAYAESGALISRTNRRIPPRNRDNDKCRSCNQLGHWERDCVNRNRQNITNRYQNHKRKFNKSPDKNNTDHKSLAFSATNKALQNGLGNMFAWVADSGCTSHMTAHRQLLMNFRPSEVRYVYTADNKNRMEVEGEGEVPTKFGTLTNVLLVPDLGQNLFSISAASERGMTHSGDKNKIRFFWQNDEIFSAISEDGLFIINFKPPQRTVWANATTLKDWHARFGHASEDIIKHMHKNQIVNDLNIVNHNNEVCECCKLNKCTQVSHPSRSSPKAKLPGTVLHVDTAGPSNVPSLSGSRFIILCKDEASGYRQIAFVQSKNQISNMVKQFISKAKLETGNSVLKLISDNGSEFVNSDLVSFLNEKGIIHEKSVPYVPSQNGFIERDIRTIKESARSMLNNSKLDKSLWPEACNTATYILNRVVNSKDKMKTPYEAWFGQKPSVKNMKTFGEMAVLLHPSMKRTGPWDQKARKAVFVGYTDRQNTYRFYIQDKPKKIIIECNAAFLDKMYNGKIIRAESEENSDDHWIVCSGGTHLGNEASNIETGGLAVDEQGYREPSEQPENDTLAEDSSDFLDPSGFDMQQQMTPLTIDVRGISTGVRGATPITREEIDGLIANHSNQDINLQTTQGVASMRLGDLKFNEHTQRWQNPRSGHFISSAHLRVIKDKLSSGAQAQMAKTSLIAQEVAIPRNLDEAMSSEHWPKWSDAIQCEMQSLIENQVFISIPESQVTKKPVGSKWVFTVKETPSGQVTRFKARIVAQGFSQIYGVDFIETYCSVVQIMTTRLLLAFAAKEKLVIRQFDVTTAFLYGNLDETIFMKPPPGFEEPGKIWQLRKSLYGLKQSPRMWNQRFSDSLAELGLKCSIFDTSVFFKTDPLIIVIVYVDDGLVFGRKDTDIMQVIECLKKQFKMKETAVSKYRGLEIREQNDGIFIHQTSFVNKITEEFEMTGCRACNNPVNQVAHDETPFDDVSKFRRLIGSLAYLADTSRPDISFIVNVLARSMSKPTLAAWNQAQNALRYLSTSKDLGIFYPKGVENEKLIAYCDSDFAGDRTTSKSTSGYLITYNGSVFHWKTQIQRHVTLSSTESEVIALCSLAKQLAWIRRMMIELGIAQDNPAIIRCDNTSAIKVAQSEKATARTRHLRAQDAFVKEMIHEQELQIEHVYSEDQLADCLTKGLQTGKFTANRNLIMQKSKPEVKAMLAGTRRRVRSVPSTKPIGLPLILVCFLISLTKAENILQYIEVDIDNPCDDLKAAIETEFFQGKLFHLQQQSSEMIFHKREYNHIVIDQCHKRFEYLIGPTLQEIERCNHGRAKRSIGTVLTTAARFAVGVTNFMMSANQDGAYEEESKWGQLVSRSTRNLLTDYKIRRPIELNDIRSLSSTASEHEKLLQDITAEVMPRLQWASLHVIREMINGIANLRHLAVACSKGYVAVKEVAEILDAPKMLTISEEETKIYRVEVDPEKMIVKIWFILEETIWKRMSKLVTTIAPYLVGPICSIILFVGYSLYKLRVQSRTNNGDVYALVDRRVITQRGDVEVCVKADSS